MYHWTLTQAGFSCSLTKDTNWYATIIIRSLVQENSGMAKVH